MTADPPNIIRFDAARDDHPVFSRRKTATDRPTETRREVDVTGIEHIPLGDLIAVYRASGYRLALTVEDLRD